MNIFIIIRNIYPCNIGLLSVCGQAFEGCYIYCTFTETKSSAGKMVDSYSWRFRIF